MSFSDHHCILLELNISTQICVGRPAWKLNVSLLDIPEIKVSNDTSEVHVTKEVETVKPTVRNIDADDATENVSNDILEVEDDKTKGESKAKVESVQEASDKKVQNETQLQTFKVNKSATAVLTCLGLF